MKQLQTIEQISVLIRRYAMLMIESRQIAQRLRRLSPEHLKLSRKYCLQEGAGSISRASKLALIQENYVEHLDELVRISYQAEAAKIQYETHMMLLNAKRTMRAFKNKF